MPYEYECHQCEVRSPRRHDQRAQADADQDEHRAAAHGGLAPAAGDGVRRVHAESRGDGRLPAGWPWALAFFLALLLANCWGR
ncbi:hypothetical protein [Streptomyces spiralis]